jgi:hypothetical protein
MADFESTDYLYGEMTLAKNNKNIVLFSDEMTKYPFRR